MKKDEIRQLAERGVAFAQTSKGMTRSDRNNWQEICSADWGTISKWLEQGDSLVAVAKPGHQFMIDLDDLDACEAKGFKLIWLDGYYLVDTPSGGLHAYGMHNPESESLTSKATVDVYQTKGDKKSGKILELKLRAASVAAPTAERLNQPKKCDGTYNPRTLGARLKHGLRPELLEWIKANAEVEASAGDSNFTEFHPDFDLAEFLESNHCNEHTSGMIDDTLAIVVDACPHCDREQDGSTLRHGVTKFLFSGASYGFKCHACGVESRAEHEEKMAEKYDDYEPWEEPIYKDSFDAKNFDVEDIDAPSASLDFADMFNARMLTTEDTQEALKQVNEVRKLWHTAAEQMLEVRKGWETYTDGDGEEKQRKKDRIEIDDDILAYTNVALKDVMKAEYFVDAYPYVFLPKENTIYKFHQSEDCYKILSRLGLRATQHDYKLVQENLHNEILVYGEKTRIEKFGCLRGEAIYVNNGRGGMFKITADEFVEVPNGTDSVYMKNTHLVPWPQLDPARMAAIAEQLDGKGGKAGSTVLCKHFNALFDEGKLQPAQYQQLVILRYLSLFIGNDIDLRPIMISIGQQNSGKSTLWEKHMWLFYGTRYESGGLPTNLRSFISAITNHQIQLFDNIDSVNFDNPRSDYPTYIDLMCKCSTGGKISIAQLYENNVDKDYELRCDLFLTSRTNPFPSHRSDLMRRIQSFPMRRISTEEYRTTESMKREFDVDAQEIKLETLVRLQLVLRALLANKGKEYPPVSQMHSYETYTMRIADFEGWDDEMVAIWQGYCGDYQERISEDSPIVNFIRCWLGKPGNIGRPVRTGQVYGELEDLYGKKFTQYWRSDAIFGRKIKENLSALEVLGVSKRIKDGCTTYTFNPGQEQVVQCANTYEDSLSKWRRGEADQPKYEDVFD